MPAPATIVQAFYWDCPRIAGVEHAWWPHVEAQVAMLADAGVTALWLPPASKSMSTQSMGYDGGDALETNLIDGVERWTKFTPKSGRFPRDWTSFHPSPYETTEGLEDFAGMPDLCHRNPQVFAEIMSYAAWLVEEIGFDGFRYDMVKAYGAWLVTALQEYRYSKPHEKPYAYRIYGVAECWDATRFVRDWLAQANHWSDNEVKAFDFELRGRRRAVCDHDGASLRDLIAPGTLLADQPRNAVTFVENHDVHRPGDEAHHHPIVHDKLLAYAYILVQPSDACIFWRDWFEYDLGMAGTPHGIERLVRLRAEHARGEMRVRWVDDSFLVIERGTTRDEPGMLLVLNNGGAWRGATVDTRWPSARFTPRAWRGRDDMSRPDENRSDESGRVELWAAARGYSVWVPER